MKSVDVQNRTLLAKGQFLSLAGSLLLVGPAYADHADRTELRQARLDNRAERHELRDLIRANRQERLQLRQDIREQTSGAKAFRAEYQAIRNSQSVAPPVFSLPVVPKNDLRSTYLSDKGRTRNVTRGLALDLTSNDRSIVLGSNLFAEKSSYTVNVGGEQRVLTSGSHVTSAEFVALQQMIDSGSQSLVIDQSGRGVDGSFTLNSIDDAGRNIKASSLTVSAGVDAVGNFGRNSDFRIKRDLVNFGNVYALTDDVAGNKATIGARNITNHADATISTQAPAAVAQANGAIESQIDLNLSAERKLNNFGTISASGSLTLSAGESITNSGSVSAHSNLNMQSTAVNNSGSIVSQAASVNFDTPLAANIFVDNTGGSVGALEGDINFRSTGFAPKSDTTLVGGNWYSKQLNLNSGDGHVNVDAHDISGVVNTYAGTVKILADTDNLNIGETVATGDPLIFNTATVNILGNQTTGGGPLTIVAGQDVTFASGLTMDTSAAGDAGDILIIAGAAFTSNPGTSITVTGASANGGNINFSGTAPVFVANSTGTGDGGDITMAAFNIAGPTNGSINLTGSTITSNGSTGNDNGNVVLIANSINVSSIDTKGAGTSQTGNIILSGTQPAVTGPLVINDPNGNVISGSIGPGTSSGSSAINVQNGSTIDAGGLYSIDGNTTNVGNATVTSGSYYLRTTNGIQINNPVVVTDSLTILSSQQIDIRNNITAPGGILMVAAQSIFNVGSVLYSTSRPGQAGNVTMVAGATYTDNGTTVTITGASGLGGAVNLSFPAVGIDSRGTGANANGGNVTLVGFADSTGGSGTISTDDPTDIFSGGTGSGINGNITIVSGNNDGFNGISYRNAVNTTGGAAGTGSITLHTTTPNSGVILSKANAGISSGTFLGGAAGNSGILANFGGTLTTNGGAIDLLAGRNGSQAIDIETVTAGTGSVRINAVGVLADLRLRNIQGGGITVTSTGTVDIRDNWSTSLTGGGILIVAGRDIQNVTNGDFFTTTNSGAGQQAGSVTFIAGATFSETLTNITITGSTATGGTIDLGNNVDFIHTTGLSGAGGGDVNMIAYADPTGGRGLVLFDTGTDVTTQGDLAGKNGDILVVAGNDQGITTIRTGGVWDTAGGLSGTGNVSLTTAQPVTGASISKSTGAIVSGGFTAGAVMKNGSITSAGGYDVTTDANAAYSLTTGNQLDFTNTNINVGRARFSVDNFVQGIANVTATGSITITTRIGDVNVRGNLTAPGGIVMVAGGAISNINNLDALSTQNATGDGGDIVLVSGATFSENATNITITGASNNGGNGIGLGNGFASINTRGLGANASGGNITLIGYDGGSGGANLFVQNGATILTGGSGSGANGNIVVASGKNNGGTGVQIEASIDTTGGVAGTGDVSFNTTAPNTGITITKNDGSLSGSFLGGAGRNSQVFQPNGSAGITVDSADVVVHSGAAIFMQNVNTGTAGTVMYNSGLTGTPAVANFRGVTTGSLSVTSTGDIDLRGGDLVARAGILLVAGGSVLNNGGGMQITAAGANDAGDIVLVAGAAFTQNATSVTVTGASSTGGNIDVGNGFLGFDARSTSGSGDGGDITLIAYADTATGAAGRVFGLGNTAAIRAGGTSGGANGDVLIIGSNNQGIDGIALDCPITVAGGDVGTGSVTLKTVAPGVNVTVDRTTLAPTGTFDSTTTRNSRIVVQDTVTADGGNIDILSGQNVLIDALTITPTASGDAGFIRVETNGSEFLQLGSGGTNSIGDVTFDGSAAGGDGGDFTAINNGTTGVIVRGNILQQNNTAGDGGQILIDADQGPLQFANGPVTVQTSGQGASPQNGGSITLLGDTLNFNGLHVDLVANQSAGGGNGGTITVVTNSAITVGTGVNQFGIQAQGANSTVTLNSTGSSITLTVPLTLTNLNLSSTNADITQTAGAALNVANVDFTMFGATPGDADFDNIVNNIGKVSGSGVGGGSGGTIFLDNGAGNLLLGDLGAAQSLTAQTTGTMATAENITAGGDIVLTTANLTNNFSIAANSITVTSQAGSGLTVSGTGGSFNATGSGEIVQLNATNGDLDLFGTQTYVSVTEMNSLSPGSTFRVNSSANITGQQLLTVNTDLVELIGLISGNPLVINSTGTGGGTIANSIGDVTLIGDIIFNGNISIIAKGNVIAGTATNITLSGGATGGTLTVLAGFDFTPATAGQVNFDTTTTFTGFTANATGGSINLGSVVITTSASSSAGNVLLVANGGTTNSGGVSTGDIDASSGSGAGGNVQIIGEGAITVGNINTSGLNVGGNNSGSVDIKVASSQIVGLPQVLNGTLSGGTFAAATIGSANITTGDINAGTAQLLINTSGNSSSVAVGNLTGNTVDVSAGNLDLSRSSFITALAHPDTSLGGLIRLQSNTLTLNNSAASAVALNADAIGSGTGGTIIIDTNEQGAFFVGNVPKAKTGHFFTMSARGGATGGDGGTINISVGGNLSVDTSKLDASAGAGGDGAHYKLEAGSTSSKGGSLAIFGDIYASGPSAAFGGSIELISNSSKNFTLGDTKKTPKNGVMGQLTALGLSDGEVIVNNRNGGILVYSGNGITANSVELRAGGKGTIAAADGAVITALNDLELFSDTGDIGKKPLSINARILTVATQGAARINSVRGGLLTLNDSSAKSLMLTTVGALSLNDISASDGNICINAYSGTLSVGAGTHIQAVNGEICLLNCNTLSGNISIGANSVVETTGADGKRVVIAIDNPPKSPVPFAPPLNFDILEDRGGRVIFASPATGFATGTAPASLNAFGEDVILYNGSTQSATQKITFADSAIVTASSGFSGGSGSRTSSFQFQADNAALIDLSAADPVVGVTTVSSASAAGIASSTRTVMSTAISSSPGIVSQARINPSSNIGSQAGTIGSALLYSSNGSAFNSQSVTAVPTDLLSSISKTAGEETTLVSTLSVGAIGSVQLADESVTNNYITEAYVWCDEDLGLGSATTLKRGNSENAINNDSNVEVANLRKGTIVLAPSKDTRLHTPLGTINVGKGSVALVVLDETRLGVYDLHDARKGSVRVSSGANATTLSPGHCTVLTNQVQNSFEHINPMESIGYRSVASLNHGNGIRAFNAEFATTHALGSVKPLMEILTSEHAGARRMASRLIKTSAVLMHLGRSDIEDFKIYAEPSVTAMFRGGL
jgi:hypothetical protein